MDQDSGKVYLEPLIDIHMDQDSGKITSFILLNSQIKNFPSSLQKLDNCKYIKIQNCPIETLSFLPRKSIVVLTIDNCPIQDYKELLFCKKIQDLTLNNMGLLKTPEEIFVLSELKSLNLDFNKITHVEFLRDLFPNLEILSLEGNPIKELPREIKCSQKLKQVNLSGTLINGFPDALKESVNLIIFTHRNAHLSDFPRDLLNLKYLEVIDLGQNQIQSIPKEVFNLPYFKHGIFSENQITEIDIPENIHKEMFILLLRKNNLGTIPIKLFNQLDATIELSDNQFSDQDQFILETIGAISVYPIQFEYYLDSISPHDIHGDLSNGCFSGGHLNKKLKCFLKWFFKDESLVKIEQTIDLRKIEWEDDNDSVGIFLSCLIEQNKVKSLKMYLENGLDLVQMLKYNSCIFEIIAEKELKEIATLFQSYGVSRNLIPDEHLNKYPVLNKYFPF